MKRFGIPDPDNFKARLLASVLNRNDVTRPHLAADARKQRATTADARRDDLLGEGLTGLVSRVYSDDKTFIYSKLAALFHRGQPKAFGWSVR